MSEDKKHTILVTGFGPFGKHIVNASWEAVKELKQICKDLEEQYNLNVVIKEIPVSYDYVNTEIQKLWKDHDPMMVIHVGVNHGANCLRIEKYANSTGYNKLDIHKKCPDELNIKQVLKTDLDIEMLCEHVNKNSSNSECKACISYDAGRYLCEYTFYQSLCIKPHRTLFIHVPDFNTYTSSQTAKGLYDIVYYLTTNLIRK